MTDAADLVIVDGEVRTLDGDGRIAEAVAVRDGAILRVGSSADVRRLAGVETTVLDVEGRVVVPGLIDAHTHFLSTGRHLVFADLTGARTREEAFELLRDEPEEGWIVGFGYDESAWSEGRLLDADDLDSVSDDRPVAAFRVDMHSASLNSAALARVVDRLDPGDVLTEGGEPTGVVVEEAVGTVKREATAERGDERDLVEAAMALATSRGITCVHEMVRNPRVARAIHDLDVAGELPVRVRMNYWSDHLDAIEETGLVTNHGSGFVRVGAIKTFTDGSIGSRTAKLFEPYRDGDGRGTWVVDPDELSALIDRVDGAGLQIAIHTIGDEALEVALSLLEETPDPGVRRHRIEHVELASDEQIDRLAETGIVASMQPNFLRWAGDGGLYDRRLGEARSRASNRVRDHLDAGVRVAFGSDCMPLDPLYGIHCVVNARDPSQCLTVDEAFRCYTTGSAYAGFDEDRLGSIEPGKRADLTVLDGSPWDVPDRIEEIGVTQTIVDGEIVYADRSRPSIE